MTILNHGLILLSYNKYASNYSEIKQLKDMPYNLANELAAAEIQKSNTDLLFYVASKISFIPTIEDKIKSVIGVYLSSNTRGNGTTHKFN